MENRNNRERETSSSNQSHKPASGSAMREHGSQSGAQRERQEQGTTSKPGGR